MSEHSRKFPVVFAVNSAITGEKVPIDPNRDTAIDASELTKEMSRQPGKFAYWAALSTEEWHRAKSAMFKIHCAEEDLDAALREKNKEEGKRVTDAAVKAEVKRDPHVRALYANYVKHKRKAGLLRDIRDAMMMRADMLRSIGAGTRHEMEHTKDITTLKREARERSSK